MKENKYIWLYDHVGVEIALEKFLELLPKTIRDLKNDPYRSLASILKKKGVYKKNQAPFSEFVWVNYFRKHLILDEKKDTIPQSIIDKAIILIVK